MEIKYCDSWFDKLIGYMFSFKPKILIFRFKKEKFVVLHMFFVFHKLQALFLNSKKKVIEKAILKPFSVYNPKKKAKYVIEMPEGTKLKKAEISKMLR